MSSPSVSILGENLTFTIQALSATGAPIAATGNVAYKIYEDETSTEILSGNMAQLASQTGFYSEQIATTAANGFEQFKSYVIRISATVAGVSVVQVFSFLCVGAGDTPQATSGALTTTAMVKNYAGITTSDDDTLIGYLISRATARIESYCGRTLTSDTYLERYDGTNTPELVLNHYPVTNVALLSIGTQDAIRIKNTSSDAYNASIAVTLNDADVSVSETMTLTISGGTNVGTDDLTLSSYTVSTLATAIAALGKGWSATVGVSAFGVWDAIEILPVSGIGCLDQDAYVQTPYDAESSFFVDGMQQSPYRGNAGIVHLRNRKFTRGHENIIIRYTAGYATTPADLEQACIDLTLIYYKSRKQDLTIKSEKLATHAIVFADTQRGLTPAIMKVLANYKSYRI